MAKAEVIEIPVKLSGIAAIRKELKDIKGDVADNLALIDDLTSKSDGYRASIAKGGSPEEMERLNRALEINEKRIVNATKRNVELSLAAGQVKDRLVQINEQIDVFSSGSAFEQASKSLGLIGSQLASLDFEGAGESALLLQKQIMGITPEQVKKQVDGLIQTFNVLGKVAGQTLTGLVKNVGGIAKAFLNFGKALLGNPIFLIATAFITIATVIGLVLNKLGLLKPLMDAIGAVFEWIGKAIDEVVQNLKDFLDLIGLTDFAAEDSAKRQTAAAEKKADAYEKSSKRVQFYLDEEIKLAQIAGNDTTDLELEKQVSIRKTAQVRLEALKAKLAENKLTGELDQEELKALYEKIRAQKEILQISNSESKLIRAQDVADREKDAEDAAKEAEAKAKEAAAKRKQYLQDRVNAERQAMDAELANMADGYAKEIAMSAEKFRRIQEDLKRNSALTQAERKRLSDAYKIQEQQDLEELFEKRKQATKDETAEIVAALEEVERVRKERLVRDGLAERELRAMLGKEGLALELSMLELRRQQELDNTELTENEKKLIEERYRLDKAAAEKKAAEDKAALQKQQNEEEVETYKTAINSIGALSDLSFEIKKGNLKEGSEQEEAAAKKNFETNKKVQISVAAISGIQGVINALTAKSILPEPLATIARVANAVSVGVSTAVNIAKIRNTQYGGSSGGGSTGGGGASPATNSTGGGASPSVNLFGSANQLSNLQDNASTEIKTNKIEVNVKAFVPADEMSAQQKVEQNIIKGSKL